MEQSDLISRKFDLYQTSAKTTTNQNYVHKIQIVNRKEMISKHVLLHVLEWNDRATV